MKLFLVEINEVYYGVFNNHTQMVVAECEESAYEQTYQSGREIYIEEVDIVGDYKVELSKIQKKQDA